MRFGKIEKGIKVPQYRSKYPFWEMGINDSVLIEAGDDVPYGLQNRVKVAASIAGKRHNMVFAVRACNGGVRVWRTK